MKKNLILSLAALIIALTVWAIAGRETGDVKNIFVTPKQGEFHVIISASGELRARNSMQIIGPRGARDVGVYQLSILDMVSEGTIVSEGDFVAQLDLADLHNRMQNVELQLQRVESQYEQAQLDSSLSLTQARYNLENLAFLLEERQIAVQQSIYESPAVQRQVEIELERTERQLEQEKGNYETRLRQSIARLREIEAGLISEQNRLLRIRMLENEFTINAPRDGMIVYVRDNRGQRTMIGSTLSIQRPLIAEMPDFGAMESITYINEVDVRRIQRGQPVTVTLDADRDMMLTGEVVSIANIGEQRSGTDARVFEVVIHINEHDTELRPTMTTENRVLVQTVPDAIYAPLEAIHLIENVHFAFKKEGSNLFMQQVLLGAMNENEVIIVTGLSENDEILISMPPDHSELRKNMLSEEEMEKHRDKLERQEQELIVTTPETRNATRNRFSQTQMDSLLEQRQMQRL